MHCRMGRNNVIIGLHSDLRKGSLASQKILGIFGTTQLGEQMIRHHLDSKTDMTSVNFI